MTTSAERAVGLTAKMYDTRRFLKDLTSVEVYAANTAECRKMIEGMMSSRDISELDAALEVGKFVRDQGKEELIGWVVAAAIDMVEEKP